MQSPDESQLWCRGPSLWSLIAQHVPGSELSKIRAALGHFLVDMYTEVHAEAEMWHKMWQESQRGGDRDSRAGAPLPRQRGSPLADPPAIKELVRAEVKMLLQSLRERASRGGRDGEELLLQYKPETVNYALSHLHGCYSNRTDPGDTDNGSRLSSRCSVRSDAEDEIEAVRDKLNVTDIDQVAERLRSVLKEECEALNRLTKHLKMDIKHKHRNHSESDKSEPTLAELRELRGAVQMDLELYPSSFASSPPASSPLSDRFRLSAGQKPYDETQRALKATSILKPHPPPPACHPKPRPPAGPPPTKTSVKPISSSPLSRAHGGTLSSTESSKHHCSASPEQDGAGLHCRPLTSCPSSRIETQRNSPLHESHLSSHGSYHSLSRVCDLSPQRERKCSSVRRLENISITPSPVPAPDPESDGGSNSNSPTDHSGSAAGKSQTQNGQKESTCGGGLVSDGADNERKNSPPESFHSSVTSEPGSHPAENGDRRDVTQRRSRRSRCLTDCASHHSESSGEQGQAKCAQPASVQLNGQFFTCPKGPLGATTRKSKSVREGQTEPEFISKFNQPVPPARVST